MKKKIFLTTLLMLVAVITIMPLSAQACHTGSVEITKHLRCPSGEGWSDNPPYYVGQKYYFWIVYEVKANTDLTDVVVYDNFGAELMIEGICVYWTTVLTETYDYGFDYDPYAYGGDVEINGDDNNPEGYLDTNGVEITGTAKGNFYIFWTGSSVKAHLKWEIGNMNAGTTTRIYVIVSTDTNPAGKQEYTSGGRHVLNSGATVKARIAATGRRVSAVSNTIVIEVEGDTATDWTFQNYHRHFSHFNWWRHH